MAKTTCEYKEPDIADSELQVTLSPNVFALQRPPPPGGLCGAGGQHGVTPQPALPEEKPSAAVPGKLRGTSGSDSDRSTQQTGSRRPPMR